jgi:hypothetical protein
MQDLIKGQLAISNIIVPIPTTPVQSFTHPITMSTSTSSSNIDTGAALAHAFAAGMNACDIPALQDLLAPGAQYALLPRTLGRPAMPARDGLAMFSLLKQMVPDFKVSLATPPDA